MTDFPCQELIVSWYQFVTNRHGGLDSMRVELYSENPDLFNEEKYEKLGTVSQETQLSHLESHFAKSDATAAYDKSRTKDRSAKRAAAQQLGLLSGVKTTRIYKPRDPSVKAQNRKAIRQLLSKYYPK